MYQKTKKNYQVKTNRRILCNLNINGAATKISRAWENHILSQREHRVMDKALDFHADDPGSIPVGGEEVGCGIYSLNQ